MAPGSRENLAASQIAADVRAALAQAVILLEKAKVPSAPFTAELLLIHVLGRDRAWLYAHPEHPLSADQQSAYFHAIYRRATGVPTQHLTGTQEFWGLDFEVSPAVLIPRPETEHLVEVALARLSTRRDDPLRIADIGTGSGCLAVALAHEFPHAQVTAVDISSAALLIARRNAERHGVYSRIDFVHADARTFHAANDNSVSAPSFDLVVSNPPYVGLREASQLAREVLDHEPHQALFAGQDGLDFYPPLVSLADRVLVPGGLLIVELGHASAPRVRELLTAPAWTALAIERDLAGIERVFSAERTATPRGTSSSSSASSTSQSPLPKPHA